MAVCGRPTGLTHLDHVTLVCRPGQSGHILDWYRDTCGMQTFVIKPGQASQLEVEGEDGLRLVVGSWLTEWLCREVGGHIQRPGQPHNNFKLVLAEPLGRTGHVTRRVLSSQIAGDEVVVVPVSCKVSPVTFPCLTSLVSETDRARP